MDIVITSKVSIPESELEWRFDTSGGPGGQHANRSNTRAEVRFDVGASPSIPEGLRQRLLSNLESRLRGGVLAVTVDDTRSQWRNRSIARARLKQLLADAAQPPDPPRRPTKASHASRKRMSDRKRRKAETKRLRQRPDVE